MAGSALRPASRVQAVPSSLTTGATARAQQLIAEGRTVIDLSSGEPSFDTPGGICNAAARSLRHGDTRYSPTAGIPELRSAIARKLRQENDLAYEPEQILVTPSAKFALYAAMATVLEPGDEIIIPSPAWVSFAPMATMLDAQPVRWRLSVHDDFAFNIEHLRSLITARTKAILVNSPNNPTGQMLQYAHAEALMALAAEHDLAVISDEIYERIVFDGAKHVSPGSIGDGTARTLTINGFSKSHAMTGWRLGYLACPTSLIAAAIRFQEHTVTCAASFVQVAALEALRDTAGDVERMRSIYQVRRDAMVEGLNAVPGIVCPKPQGAFYVFPRFSESLLGGRTAADWLLTEVGVVGVTGAAFDPDLSTHARLSIASSDDKIEAALVAIHKAAQ